MKKLFVTLATLFSLVALGGAAAIAASSEVTNSVVGVQGYDLVSYHLNAKPLQGNGNHLVLHKGVNYLFSSAENQATFLANPEKYLPAYGGYCAFGVAVNKKFIGDPTVWDIVDGKLYFNLDNKVKNVWIRDIPGNIQEANGNWKKIQSVPAAKLNAQS